MAWKDALSGSTIAVAELYVFTFRDGTIKRFTSFEDDIVFQTNTYSAVYIERSKAPKDTDLSTGKLTIIVPRDDDYVDVSELLDGILDRGEIELYQVQRSNHSNYRMNFKGVVGDVNFDESTIRITFLDEFNLLKKPLPRRLYSESCPYTFGDDDCGLDVETLDVSGTADSGSDANTLIDAARSEADGYFTGGYLVMTSGANNGLKRAVSLYVVGTVSLISPFPNTIGVGDTYQLYPYCQKTYAGCDAFSNTDQYGAFKNIPRPDDIYG